MRQCLTPGCPVLVQGRPRCEEHTLAREHARPNIAVRRWYRTARWKALRARVFRESPFCDGCEREGIVTEATEADHTIPHRGDARLFWSRDNVRGLCQRHHLEKTLRGE